MNIRNLITRACGAVCTLLSVSAGATAAMGEPNVAMILAAGAVCFYALTMYCLVEVTRDKTNR